MSRERVLHPQRGAAQAALLIAAAIGLCVVLGTLWLQANRQQSATANPVWNMDASLFVTPRGIWARPMKTRPCDIPALPWTAPPVTSTPAPGPARCRCYRLPSAIPDFPAATAGRRSQRPHQWLYDAQYERQGTGSGERPDALHGNVYQTT